MEYAMLIVLAKVNDFTSRNNIVDKKHEVRGSEKQNIQKVRNLLWKVDVFTKASIDAMEMQILRQILLRMGARAQERKRERKGGRVSVRN